ncbi:hypothetical protein [Nostoc sp. WHI]|uniref:hypothetical protein n=1 Tax=Nostoc sp. WHI TaxID=2650611 RepID=UPI0018C56A6D|nr:hypothetical protein [Nostoc sp. WHI]MBG1265513.1 hypothetical protein [Nostoc sp. WHI]
MISKAMILNDNPGMRSPKKVIFFEMSFHSCNTQKTLAVQLFKPNVVKLVFPDISPNWRQHHQCGRYPQQLL